MITREDARHIGLKILEGKNDYEFYRVKDKNIWTVEEFREAFLNDTKIENGENPIDELMRFEERLNEEGRSLKTVYPQYFNCEN